MVGWVLNESVLAASMALVCIAVSALIVVIALLGKALADERAHARKLTERALAAGLAASDHEKTRLRIEVERTQAENRRWLAPGMTPQETLRVPPSGPPPAPPSDDVDFMG